MGTCVDRDDVVSSLVFQVNARFLRKVHSAKRVAVILGEMYNPELLELNYKPITEDDVKEVLNE